MDNCEICQGRGYIYDDSNRAKKCICVVRRELIAFLGHLTQYAHVKDYDYHRLHTSLVLRGGNEHGFYSLVKSYLISTYFTLPTPPTPSYYKLTSGAGVIESYIAEENLPTLYRTPTLFFDCTRYLNNKVMGDVSKLVLQTRNSTPSTITWVYLGDLTPPQIESLYGTAFLEIINTPLAYGHQNIDTFTAEALACIKRN